MAVTLLSDLEHSYSPQEERPLRGYLGVMGAYGSVVAGLGFALRRRTLPDRLGIQDIGQVALATHKLSRLITKAPITSPRRAPPSASAANR